MNAQPARANLVVDLRHLLEHEFNEADLSMPVVQHWHRHHRELLFKIHKKHVDYFTMFVVLWRNGVTAEIASHFATWWDRTTVGSGYRLKVDRDMRELVNIAHDNVALRSHYRLMKPVVFDYTAGRPQRGFETYGEYRDFLLQQSHTSFLHKQWLYFEV